jgi:trehalose-6-phosphate synthase
LEEAGGPDSYYVNPDDSDAMAATLNDILSTDQQERIARSQEYVKQFENANVAQQILKEYDLLLGR